MRVLVTGSSGFIGRHLVTALSAAGHCVSGLDAMSNPLELNDFTFRRVDILDGEALTETVQEFAPQAIVHLAARTDLDETATLASYAANVEGVENVIAAIRATPEVQRCLFTSSQLVCRVGYIPEDDEDYAPNTLYGRSKVLTEQIVRHHAGGGVSWCLVRPTTVWGPGMNEHFQRFLRLIYRGLYFHIGRDPVFQPYGYVGNVTRQYLKLLEAPRQHVHGRTLYLADYEPLSLRAWTNALQREMGAPKIRTMPRPLAEIAARTGDFLVGTVAQDFPLTTFRLKNLVTEYHFDLTETRRICGRLPYSMEEGVRRTVRWLRAEEIVPTP